MFHMLNSLKQFHADVESGNFTRQETKAHLAVALPEDEDRLMFQLLRSLGESYPDLQQEDVAPGMLAQILGIHDPEVKSMLRIFSRLDKSASDLPRVNFMLHAMRKKNFPSDSPEGKLLFHMLSLLGKFYSGQKDRNH